MSVDKICYRLFFVFFLNRTTDNDNDYRVVMITSTITITTNFTISSFIFSVITQLLPLLSLQKTCFALTCFDIQKEKKKKHTPKMQVSLLALLLPPSVLLSRSTFLMDVHRGRGRGRGAQVHKKTDLS